MSASFFSELTDTSQDEFLLELNTMYHYLLIEVLGTRTLIMREPKVNLNVMFVRPNGQHVSIGKVGPTITAGTHDLEHLVQGVGFSIEEEALTGALITQYGLASRANWLKSTGFTKQDVENYNKFLSNIFWTNKPGTYKLSKVSGKLTIEQVS
jgi:hypothetical protein